MGGHRAQALSPSSSASRSRVVLRVKDHLTIDAVKDHRDVAEEIVSDETGLPRPQSMSSASA